jgi:urease accessory protein
VLLRLHQAWLSHDIASVEYWNAFLLASRESHELQQEDHHLAQALARLLSDLGVTEAQRFIRDERASYATLFALAAVHWQVSATDTLQGYLWSWAENQVAAAIKLVPLGQTAGQRILLGIGDLVPTLIEAAQQCVDDEIGQVTQRLAMASAWHETQYTRLFRS